MSKLTLGCSPLTGTIFAGKVLKDVMWCANKVNVTDSAVGAVAEHLIHCDESVEFT